MKKSILCLVGFLCSCGVFAQDSPAKNYWTSGTAYTVQKHRWEPGLFTLSNYGLTDKLEISAHPLMVFLLPQVQLKVGWGDHAAFRLATEHGIIYPTLFMRTVATKGIGGLISPEFSIPQMIAVYNRFLISYRPLSDAILTASAGVSFSINSGSLPNQSTIDLPIIYPRFAAFYDQPGFDLGIDFRGKFAPRLGWDFKVQNYFFSGTTRNYFLENKGVIAYTSKRDKLRLEAGYKLCYGKYPDGNRWHLLPDINLVFGFGK